MIKVLLDSSTMGMFIDRKIAAKYGFRLQKLERPVRVKNVDGTYNSGCKGDWAQDSRRILSYIIVCDYDTTYLQENPQRLG